jgi:hypothetical protein
LAIAGAQVASLGKANFLPDIDPSLIIETPHYNRTYTIARVTLNFTATTNWGVYPVFYSLDGQENVAVENVTVISEKEATPPSGLSVTRTTVRGRCVLSNLTEGWHNLTLYMIVDREVYLYKTYEKGEILSSESTRFFIDTVAEPESFPVVPVVAVSAASITAVACAGLILTRRKHRKEAQQT